MIIRKITFICRLEHLRWWYHHVSLCVEGSSGARTSQNEHSMVHGHPSIPAIPAQPLQSSVCLTVLWPQRVSVCLLSSVNPSAAVFRCVQLWRRHSSGGQTFILWKQETLISSVTLWPQCVSVRSLSSVSLSTAGRQRVTLRDRQTERAHCVATSCFLRRLCSEDEFLGQSVCVLMCVCPRADPD